MHNNCGINTNEWIQSGFKGAKASQGICILLHYNPPWKLSSEGVGEVQNTALRIISDAAPERTYGRNGRILLRVFQFKPVEMKSSRNMFLLWRYKRWHSGKGKFSLRVFKDFGLFSARLQLLRLLRRRKTISFKGLVGN